MRLILTTAIIIAVVFHGFNIFAGSPLVRLNKLASEFKQSLPDYWVGEGSVEFFLPEDCIEIIEKVGNCQGNNPASPYGIVKVPFATGEFQTSFESNTFVYRMRPDEAIVLIGFTPPKAEYFSFRSYLLYRDFQNLNQRNIDSIGRFLIFASLGDSLNHKLIKTGGGDDPFSQPMILISTASRQMDGRLRLKLEKLLNRFDLPTDIINTDVIPEQLPLHLGYEGDKDSFSLYMRVAFFDDEQAGREYIDNSGLIALRIVPNGEAVSDPLPIPELRNRVSGVDENPLLPDLDKLVSMVKGKFETESGKSSVYNLHEMNFEGYDCIENSNPCLGGNRDAISNISIPILLPDENSFLMIAGINHAKTAPLTYTTMSVMNAKKIFGIEAIHNTKLEGSVGFYMPEFVPSVAKQDELYIYKIARNCEEGNPYCLEIQEGELGIGKGETIMFIERNYLNCDTIVGPGPGEAIPPKLITFR